MVAVGLWYGLAYVMDNEHRCILLMAFLMHRDTVTRSWGPLLCHSSTTITSCCSMIMHGPLLQVSVHNSWKLKTSQFLHGQHTHRTCHRSVAFIILVSVYIIDWGLFSYQGRNTIFTCVFVTFDSSSWTENVIIKSSPVLKWVVFKWWFNLNMAAIMRCFW